MAASRRPRCVALWTLVFAVSAAYVTALPTHIDDMVHPDGWKYGVRIRSVRKSEGATRARPMATTTRSGVYVALPLPPDLSGAQAVLHSGEVGSEYQVAEKTRTRPQKRPGGAWQTHPDIDVVLPAAWDGDGRDDKEKDDVKTDEQNPSLSLEDLPVKGDKPMETEDKEKETEVKPTRTQSEPTKDDDKPLETEDKQKETEGNPTRTQSEPTKNDDKPLETVNKQKGTEEKPTRTQSEPTITDDRPMETEDKQKETEVKPTTIQSEPTKTDDKPLETEDKQKGTEKKPTRTQSEPTKSDNKPMETESEPTKADNKPMETESESTNNESAPMTTGNEPTETKEKPTRTESEPTISDNKPMKTEDKPTKTESKPMMNDNKPMETEDKPTKTESEPMKASDKPTDTESKPTKTASEPLKIDSKPMETKDKPTNTPATPPETDVSRKKLPNTEVVLPSLEDAQFGPDEAKIYGEEVQADGEEKPENPLVSQTEDNKKTADEIDKHSETPESADMVSQKKKPTEESLFDETNKSDSPDTVPDSAQVPNLSSTILEQITQKDSHTPLQFELPMKILLREGMKPGVIHEMDTATEDAPSKPDTAKPTDATPSTEPPLSVVPPEFRKNHAARPQVRPRPVASDFIAENPLYEWTFPCSQKEKSCLDEDRVFYERDRQCYQLWRTGPCEPGQWLVIDKEEALNRSGHFRAVCTNVSKCPAREVYMARDRRCHPLSQIIREVCPKHEGLQLSYNVFGEGECKCDNCPAPQLPTNTFNEGRCAFPPSFYRAGLEAGLQVAFRAAMAAAQDTKATDELDKVAAA